MISSMQLKPPSGASAVSRRKFSRAIGCFLGVLGIAISLPSEAQVSRVSSVIRYVGIDHEMHTAYIYDENFERLPDNPNVPGSSIDYFPDKPRWLLGFNVDVIKRHEDGMIEVVSHKPAYSEMVHHLVFTYVSSHRPDVDECTHRPIGAGSELTDFSLPAGYAYEMQGGALTVLPPAWHWENPANIPHTEHVYLRFVLLFDDGERAVYRNTHVTWVGTVPCLEEFAIPPGRSEKEGPPVEAPRNMRIVALHPHTHDHVEYIELRQNGNKLRRFEPENARVPVAHDDVSEGETPLHVHKEHLPTQGLYSWVPGAYGPIIKKGDELSTFGKFNNPHSRAIDNMALFFVFWEEVRL